MSSNRVYESDSLFTKYLRIFFVVSGYWIVSILTVFVNKALLSDIKLNAPMFIAFSQTLITALICYTKKCLSKAFPGKVKFPDVDVFDIHLVRDVLPLSILFTMMITTNNLCLKFVSVAFYYIGRSLTTIFNVLLTFLILRERTSKACIFCCAVIIFGFYMGVDQESLAGSLSVWGTIFGVLGSLSLSLFSIFTKRILPRVNGEIWTLSYANNVYASFMFIPLIILNDELSELSNYEYLNEPHFWFILFIGGLCGFAIGFLTSLQIKYTSALTHNISGTAKACVQTILATYWYEETKSLLWWTSNAIILIGSAAYARLKQIDMEKSHRMNPTAHKV